MYSVQPLLGQIRLMKLSRSVETALCGCAEGFIECLGSRKPAEGGRSTHSLGSQRAESRKFAA